MKQKLVDDILGEMDWIYGSRERTFDILLRRFVSLALNDELFTKKCLADNQSHEARCKLWVDYRRATRKVPGYAIVRGRDPIKEGRKQPLLIKEILTPGREQTKKVI